LYDKSLLNSYRPRIPVIAVGNLIAGGTGKTPMVAWLAKELSQRYRVAILSRGYGRSTRGFLYLDNNSTPDTVGDEPMELRFLLPEIAIAVDSNRTRGIEILTSGKYGEIDLIVMDDGFQHRRVAPGFAIVLDDFNRPMRREKLLPAGLRREPLSGLRRANLIIETKKQNSREISRFSSPIILISGIANPQPLADEISRTGLLCCHLKFPDHHRYTSADARLILKTYVNNLPPHHQVPPVLLTTGKDYVKLSRLPELSDLHFQLIPTRPPINPDQEQEILTQIYRYVEKTYGNS
jgi:tetraacyldisaccharide 4'-kinase